MTIGLIGCGNMGGALLRGLVSAFPERKYAAYTRTPSRLEPFEKMGVRRVESLAELVRVSDCIILAVKPYQVKGVLMEASPELSPEKLLVSIAAGLTLSSLEKMSGGRCALVRSMPDTPALVGKGVFAMACSEKVSRAQAEEVKGLFSALGLCFELAEEKFAAFSALVGAGPAYVFSAMQAWVQAGVTLGFGHSEARRMVEGLVEGCAVLASGSKEHLTALRDQVCSPAGLTIDGVNELDRRGLNGILVDAVLAAYARGLAMEREH